MTVDDACTGCRRVFDPGDRFCAGCGLVLGFSPSVVETARQPELIESAASDSNAAVSSGTGSLRGRVLTAALIVLVGLMAWRTFQPPTKSLDDTAAAIGAADARVPSYWTNRPPDEPLIAMDPQDIAGGAPASGVEPSAEPSLEADLPPIAINELVGLDDHYLIVANFTQVVRLDPATGAIDTFQTSGLAVGHHGNELVLVHVAGVGEIRLADIADPGTRQRLVHNYGDTELAGLDMSGDGTVTLTFWQPVNLNSDSGGHESLSIDLESEQQTKVPADIARVTGWNGLDFKPGYGTYEVGVDGEHRWLSDGLVEVVGEQVVLLRRCEKPGDCERFWLDRPTGMRVDRLVPPDGSTTRTHGFFGPDDRFLVLANRGPGRIYFDTVTGTSLAGPDERIPNTPFDLTVETVSPDGRYLMAPAHDAVIVHDLETGASGRLTVDIAGVPVKVDLVPKATMADG